jgi:DNA-binding transcriptional ArsR family regulator
MASAPRTSPVPLEPRIAKALAHPLRFRVLWRLNEVVASPKELAAELGESLPKVAYHVNVLHDAGLIELVRETPRRGATEHHYRALMRAFLSDADWARLPLGMREQLSGTVVAEAVDDLREAAAAGRLDARLDRHLSYTTLTLDESAWDELGALLNQLLERAIELQAESKRRRAGGDPIAARLTMLLYDGAPTPGRAAS